MVPPNAAERHFVWLALDSTSSSTLLCRYNLPPAIFLRQLDRERIFNNNINDDDDDDGDDTIPLTRILLDHS